MLAYFKLSLQDEFKCIGGACCRVDERNRCYMMTLGVLAAYRNYGVGTLLLNSIIETCKLNGNEAIELHVQTTNQNALNFYLKRGFQIAELVPEYYRRIEDRDAHRLEMLL